LTLILWVAGIVTLIILLATIWDRSKSERMLRKAHVIALSTAPSQRAAGELVQKLAKPALGDGALNRLFFMLTMQLTAQLEVLELLAAEHVNDPNPALTKLFLFTFDKSFDWVTMCNVMIEELNKGLYSSNLSDKQIETAKESIQLLREIQLVMLPIRQQLQDSFKNSGLTWTSPS